jgi:hypothetical protein
MGKAKPAVDKLYRLKKFPGKGGWTYIVISEILPDKRAKFGWVKVKGSIDSFKLKDYKLMPMANGKLFLPVRAEIRKAIKKEEGDSVHVVLYYDNSKYVIPTEIWECFQLEPEHIYNTFVNFTDNQQKSYIDWVYAAKRSETRAERIAIMMERVARGKKMYDPDEEI